MVSTPARVWPFRIVRGRKPRDLSLAVTQRVGMSPSVRVLLSVHSFGTGTEYWHCTSRLLVQLLPKCMLFKSKRLTMVTLLSFCLPSSPSTSFSVLVYTSTISSHSPHSRYSHFSFLFLSFRFVCFCSEFHHLLLYHGNPPVLCRKSNNNNNNNNSLDHWLVSLCFHF